MSINKLTKKYGLTIGGAVSLVTRLRNRGHDMKKKDLGRWWVTAKKRTEDNKPRKPRKKRLKASEIYQLRQLMLGESIPKAYIYDGAGELVGEMDPMTRAKTAYPGKTLPEPARKRKGRTRSFRLPTNPLAKEQPKFLHHDVEYKPRKDSLKVREWMLRT